MNVAVWIVTGVLAALFLLAGLMKLTKSKAELVDAGQGWAGDVPDDVVRLLGAVEMAAVLGLVLPGAFDVLTWLVPVAALGLIVLMLGAIVTHGRRREYLNMGTNLMLLAAAVFIAVERIGPQRF
ncbi:DoxX family protein [Nocardioides pocheonensis]|uniref:DoxX family protein n=1 Tax=Nocardioides pocheonensis TaxID=661485 RepID=A0A3N0GHX5_9ACTN|nr:DoxX family protein [Nocardioides pocheonensis]RNM12051.1 DoxX family protein [Nocardioides pocheonensis]